MTRLASFRSTLAFGVLISSVAARTPINHFVKRQEPVQGVNTYASIVPSEEIEWVPCYENSGATQFGQVSCARLIAPLDYSDVSAGQVQLALVKVAAAENSTRTVFVNIGGPGGDPVDSVTNDVGTFLAQTGNDTDIIAIVPRGVGSTFPPITCDTTDEEAYIRDYATDSASPGYSNTSIGELYTLGEGLGYDCRAVAGDLNNHLGTLPAARDMNYVLDKLGLEKLDFLGYSYGTFLGAAFAALFPDRVGHMVLDGVIDASDYTKVDKDPRIYLEDSEAALDTFFQFCSDAGDKCALHADSAEGVRERLEAVDARLRERPFHLPTLGLMNWVTWQGIIFSALYAPAFSFPLFASFVAEVESGEPGNATKQIVEGFLSSDPPEPMLIDPETGLKNSYLNSFLHITCADSDLREGETTLEDLAELGDRFINVSPRFGGLGAVPDALCWTANLPNKNRFPVDFFENVQTSTPILFVSSTLDPITPLRNAEKMSEQFEGSGLLVVNGTGHTSTYSNPTFECAEQYIIPYFRDGTLPPPGTICEGNQAPFG